MIRARLLDRIADVRHGFFTRAGGASAGIYATLNCGLGSADDPERVRRNRAGCAAELGVPAAALVSVYQVHGTDTVRVERPWDPDERPRADAMVATGQGVALGILTADCAPILLADGAAGIIGAAHAGWKGAKNGIIESVVAAMAALGAAPARMVAAIGPTIGLASYEVGAEFRDGFLALDPANARFFRTPPGQKPHFDLAAYVAERLEAAGIGQVERIEADTCAEPERFFSYRRACLTGEPDYGRQLSAIALG